MAPAADDLRPLERALGDLLAAHRAAAGITQQELARRVGYARVTVATAESGHRQPAEEFWIRCEDALGTGHDLRRAYRQLAGARERRRQESAARVQADRVARATWASGVGAPPTGARRPSTVGAVGSSTADLASLRPVTEQVLPVGAGGRGGTVGPVAVGEPVTVAVAGGRFFDGSSVQALSCEAVDEGRILAVFPDREVDSPFLRGAARGLLVCGVADADRSSPRAYGLDSRELLRRLRRAAGAARVPVPRAYELDDVTLGMLWAVANLDESLLGDDALLVAHRDRSAGYEALDRSAAAPEEADGLSTVSRMWLGSDFCARHITRHSASLADAPTFWTREQSGEAASAWLLFAHKYDYLRGQADSFGTDGRLRRAFCIPAAAVARSPRWERVLLLLAIALMESFGVRTEICADSEYAAVEGFVLDGRRRAIVANWVDADGVWQVDVTNRPAILREYADISGHAARRSVTAAAVPTGRVRACADYLGLDWDWLTGRCAALGEYGTGGLLEPRSRLLSTAGLDRACRYVGELDGPGRLYATAVS